jgi:hypothetical protein
MMTDRWLGQLWRKPYSRKILPSNSPSVRGPFPSVKAIADSKLVHLLHRTLYEAAAATPFDEDSVSIADLITPYAS